MAARCNVVLLYSPASGVVDARDALASLPPHSTTLRDSHYAHPLRYRHFSKRLGAAMLVHQIDGVGHTKLLQGLAERIDDLSGQRFLGVDYEIKVRRRPRLVRDAGTGEVEREMTSGK